MNQLRENNFWELFYYIAIYSQLSIDQLFCSKHFFVRLPENRGKCYMGHPVYVYLYLHISYMCVYVCSRSSSRFYDSGSIVETKPEMCRSLSKPFTRDQQNLQVWFLPNWSLTRVHSVTAIIIATRHATNRHLPEKEAINAKRYV